MLEGMEHIHSAMRRTGNAPAARAAAIAASRVAAAGGISHPLALPRIDHRIPCEIVPRKLASANARIAQFLIDAKAIKERDIPAQWRDELEVCRMGLNAWLKREIGDLRCIAPKFVLQPMADEDAGMRRSAPTKTTCSHVEILWFQHDEQQWAIGGGLERLEAVMPGLGITVLDVLDNQSRFVYPLFAPRDAHDVASMLYWYGEDDETMAVEEMCGDDAAAQATMREEMVTAKHFTEAYPAWALVWKPEKLKQLELTGIVREGKDAYAKDIAAMALELARLHIKDEFRPDIDGEFIGFGAVLSWCEDDLTVRVYDDLINMAQEGEFCDVMGEVRFALNEPEAMQAWQRSMRPRFKAMRLIDSLIWRLSQAN